MEFSEALRSWLVRRYGDTPRTEIARIAGCSVSTVNAFLKGSRRHVSLETVDRLVAGLGLAGEGIFGEGELADRQRSSTELTADERACLDQWRRLTARDRHWMMSTLEWLAQLAPPERAEFLAGGERGDVERRSGEDCRKAGSF